MEPTLLVIGREPCDTSNGPLAVGARLRLPVVEALQLTQAQHVTLADWHDQQVPPQTPSVVDRMLAAVETVVDTVKPTRRRYRRRDLRAEK
jgi:hypothetical protein